MLKRPTRQPNMTDFYLHKYQTTESITQGIVAPHKYRLPLIKKMGKQQDCLNAWTKDKKKIIEKYITKLKEIYDTNERFLLFTPPTMTRIFIEDIIEGIKTEFPNSVDLTNVFCKKENVSFSDAKYNDYTNVQLSEFIDVDTATLKSIDSTIEKIFIVDDVYASGKSLDLTKHIIKSNLDKKFEIKSGVILTTT